MFRVGLTGGIACGKSHVLKRLASRGYHTLDLDRIAHEVTARGGPAFADLVAAFGAGVLSADGGLDRKALGARVFGDSQQLETLNAIVHPRVREEEARRAAAWSADPAAIVVSDAALLVEAGLHLRFDRLIVVHCTPGQQLQRLMARDGLEEEDALARIAAQLPLGEKRRFAHFEIDTSGSFEDTARTTDDVAERIDEIAASRAPRLRLSVERALGALVHGPRSGPRGLTPALLLGEIAAGSGLELAVLARLLVPPAGSAWYRAARAGESGPGPETLAVPLVLWALDRGGPDPEFVFAAAASLARLTHRDGEAVANACSMARALLEVAVEGRVPLDLEARAAAWGAHAERWGGAPPARALAAAFGSAARSSPDVAAAKSGCGGAGAELAGALVGLAAGAGRADAPSGVVAALDRLQRPR